MSESPAPHPESLLPFKSVSIRGRLPGPRLIVLGAVHGNETCGSVAQRRLLDEIDAGRTVITSGLVTFVPVANALAYACGRRMGDRNLNRALAPTTEPRVFEDHVANWLCPLLAAHDVLLDLHSFQADGQPFVMVGPPDNDGPIEPFALAGREEALARSLGVGRAVDGWLSTYARGARVRSERPAASGAERDLDWRFGVGTTEYMRSCGGYAVTLECGQHRDLDAPRVAERAIRGALSLLGLTRGEPPTAVVLSESLHLQEVVDKLHVDDRLARAWRSFDAIVAGEVIATRADGSALVAPFDGRIVFPNPSALPDEEWFYLACNSDRFAPAAG